MFINAIRLSQQGASATIVANTLTTWSLVYLVACPVIGRFVTAANASRLMVASMGGLSVLSLLFTLIPGVVGVYILMALAGIATALFFLPFQVFMKAVDGANNKPLTYSTGLYTFAWSMGFAIGPFVSGLLMELGTTTPDGANSGWKYACYFASVMSALTGLAIFFLRNFVQSPQVNTARLTPLPPESKPVDYSRQPDLAWLGWISAGVGVIVLTFIRAVFPVRGETFLHLTQSFQGLLFFLLSAAQGLTGLALCRSRFWMYRPAAIAVFCALGMVGMLILGFGQSPLLLCAGAIVFGIYAGSFFFYLVFHALVHPQRSSQYVAINESVVGICTMLGAMLGGLLADRFGFGTLYATGATLILVALILQGVIHNRQPLR
jgi:DHA1 family quinolone resistance protein-like MFS transporter